MDTITKVCLTVCFIATLNHVMLTRLFAPKRPSILPSPLKTLPRAQLSSLVYPPDFFPGARDVTTPYGSIRCYEFGPETGRKVLLVHGISTSCMTLTHIARGLVARGCRVLLFDLFGRGYSDGVGDLPYDERLFVSQALCVLASSPLPWTGSEGFDVLGYSLGGGIAVHFATTFPDMVRSVVLLAPAGMIREENFGLAARLVFRSGWVPEGLLEIISRWRLKRPIADAARRKSPSRANGGATAAAIVSKLPGDKTVDATVTSEIVDEVVAAAPNELQKSVFKFVNWQVEHHVGFVSAFMSTLRYAPMLGQHVAWAKLADRKPRTVCLIFGEGDEIVNEEDYREDVLALMGGEDHVVWAKSVGGRHDFPMVHPEETLNRIFDFWG
ncbi:hypothetical protein N0V82_008077 [Gnomoniopsis sp. IMI 355080]|nr:hypothetical protein N0V82_008077 [Gnomoniopsis sp. IMI 355080]